MHSIDYNGALVELTAESDTMQQTTKPVIFIVEDDTNIRNMLRTSLKAAGYKTQDTDTGKSAVRLVKSLRPDMVLLDLGLPDIDGLEVLEEIRAESNVPVLIVSARDDNKEIVKAFDLGADDYVTKPFSIDILLARVSANLRKAIQEQAGDTVISAGELEIDLLRHEVRHGEKTIDLSPKEYALLSYLMRHKGKMLTHQALLEEVWGKGHTDDTQYLRVYMGQLRRKIEASMENPIYIKTEAGVGYRLDDPATDVDAA